MAKLGESAGTTTNWTAYKLLEYGLEALASGRAIMVDPVAQMAKEIAAEEAAERGAE